MGQRSWPEERAEIAIWLSGFLGTYKKWVDKILDNDNHDVNKNKIIDLLTDWIQKLEEEKTKIMKMSDTAVPKITEEDEERMDIIGQNGNDGLHYDKLNSVEGEDE